MIILETGFEQRSEQWHKARLGNPGASSLNKIITTAGKTTTGKTREDYLFELAAEKIRGVADETYQNAAMVQGIEREDEARSLFELLHDVEIQQVAMVYKNKDKLFHASADGLIGKDAGIEIKCPLAKTQSRYLYENKLPSQYFVQIQSSLYICERKYWWFLSYVPGMKPFILKVKRDEGFIRALELELKIFCAELRQITERIG